MTGQQVQELATKVRKDVAHWTSPRLCFAEEWSYQKVDGFISGEILMLKNIMAIFGKNISFENAITDIEHIRYLLMEWNLDMHEDNSSVTFMRWKSKRREEALADAKLLDILESMIKKGENHFSPLRINNEHPLISVKSMIDLLMLSDKVRPNFEIECPEGHIDFITYDPYNIRESARRCSQCRIKYNPSLKNLWVTLDFKDDFYN